MHSGFVAECDFQGSACKMDGFDTIGFGASGQNGPAGTYPYRYIDPAQIAPYWTMAKQYVLADHMFQTQGSGSFTGHQDLIRGNTAINDHESVIDSPSRGPWGCDAPHNPPNDTTHTSLITDKGQYRFNKGPFPCFSYATLRDLLDAKSLSWRFYTPPVAVGSSGYLWNAFDAIHAVRYSPEWKDNVISPETQVLKDAAAGQLPAVTWVIPDAVNSDHPYAHDTGPSWVSQIVQHGRRIAAVEHDGDRRRLGRLGWILRPRAAPAARLSRPRLPRAHAGHFAVRQTRIRLAYAVRVCKHPAIHRRQLESRANRRSRRTRRQHRRLFRLSTEAAWVFASAREVFARLLFTAAPVGAAA